MGIGLELKQKHHEAYRSELFVRSHYFSDPISQTAHFLISIIWSRLHWNIKSIKSILLRPVHS